ncbi:hypothetical protein HY214_04930 [Candidatus Roizmanbacteria bacterium]|nr:hypothetical protein [Candidatus Roizmanbacteria bacterium]
MSGVGATELPKQVLEASAFNQARVRIEKSRRIKNDLKPATGNFNQRRLEEVRTVEMRSEQREEGKRSGFEETLIDTRGWEEKRFLLTYVGPNGQEIKEGLVMFTRLGKGGQIEWLTTEGQPLALNEDLYDGRLNSHRHAQGRDYRAAVMPKVDGRGAYTGVVSIIETQAPIKDSNTPQIVKTEPEVGQIAQQVVSGGLPVRSGLEAIARIKKSPIDQIISKLLTKYPGEPGGIGRLGQEITLSQEELNLIQKLLVRSQETITRVVQQNPAYKEFERLHQELSRTDKGYQANKIFNNSVVEDPNVAIPTVNNTTGSKKIHLPAKLYKIYVAYQYLEETEKKIYDAQHRPADEKGEWYGRSANRLARTVSYLQNFINENSNDVVKP